MHSVELLQIMSSLYVPQSILLMNLHWDFSSNFVLFKINNLFEVTTHLVQ